MPILETSRMSRSHANGRGVFDVCLLAEAGNPLTIIGVNGSGKSTLLSVLSTAAAPSAGQVRWFGSPDRRSPEVRRRIGVVSDRSAHFNDLTGHQNAFFFARRYGLSPVNAADRLDQLLEWAGLATAATMPVAQYSLGMKRRLSLVEALCHRPGLLLLDEPTLALDHLGCADVADALLGAAHDGAAVVAASNDLELAARLGGRALLLDAGHVVREVPASATNLADVLRDARRDGAEATAA